MENATHSFLIIWAHHFPHHTLLKERGKNLPQIYILPLATVLSLFLPPHQSPLSLFPLIPQPAATGLLPPPLCWVQPGVFQSCWLPCTLNVTDYPFLCDTLTPFSASSRARVFLFVFLMSDIFPFILLLKQVLFQSLTGPSLHSTYLSWVSWFIHLRAIWGLTDF